MNKIDEIIEREFVFDESGLMADSMVITSERFRALLEEVVEHYKKDAWRLMLFVGRIIERDDGGPYAWDGGDIQTLAEKCGVFVPVNATESCGEFCECYDFTLTCYRLSELGQRCAAIATEGK